jgi:ABC-2 type transport system permease protein
MKQFRSFVRKEFRHIFRDRRTMLILLMMPVVMMLLFGFALTTEVRNTPLAVFDPSNDVATQRIVRQLDANAYFSLVETLRTPEDIDRTLREGRAGLVVVFSERFYEGLSRGEASVQLIADATDPNQARTFTAYASAIISSCVREMQPGNQPPLQIVPELRMLYNPQMKGAYNFVPGIMGMIFMLICAMMTSISIVRERERGTMETLLVSPIKPIYIILSKVTPYFAIAIIDWALILLLSVFVLDVPVAGSLLLLFFLSLLFILVALSLGLLTSTLVSSQVTAILISGIGLLMPTFLLSGMVFPIESMPKVLQWLSAVLPVRWFIAAVRKVMIQGVDAVFVAKEIAILSGMAFFLLFVSLKKFSVRLTK